MAETLNRKQIADLCKVSLPTIDAWVGRGCPVVEYGSNGRSYKFNARDVLGWRRRYSYQPKRRNPVFVEVVGRLVREVAMTVGPAAVKAGASIRTAYGLESLLTIRLATFAQDSLARNGHHGVSLLEDYLTIEDETDWQGIADEAGQSFDQDECTQFADDLIFPPGWKPPQGSPAALAAEQQEKPDV
ncbi:terminase small subunit [Methylobacterium sp. V23]|uniref:terminase small subunit n=1 Tax=Methylobacterium sp. V23 TaxID=2044878 RepID=UPI000CDB7FA9|nr:terminase small subunit [Methylobacterium sp. V23]POR42693.1 hypothetical protein CRT23_11200 [Methylobacterium sp. V23]